MSVTVFVTRAPRLTGLVGDQLKQAENRVCADQFESRQQSLKEVHAEARLISRAEIPSPSTSHDRPGRRAIYEFQAAFQGKPTLVRSESDLYCFMNGNWMVSYRITTPASVDYRVELDQFMRQLAWPQADVRRDAAPPTPSKLIFVHQIGDATQRILAGVIARGNASDIDRFSREAASYGIKAQRRGGASRVEAMTMFLAQDLDRKTILDFYHRTKGSAFNAMTLQVIVFLPEEMQKGAKQADMMRIVAPEDLEVPAD